MSGKTKPLKTGQGELIKSIDSQIAEQQTMCNEIRKEIQRYWESCNQGTDSMTETDYTKDKVVGGPFRLCFGDAVSRINGLQNNLDKIQDTITDLRTKRMALIKIYKKDTSIMGKVFYYREVAELSQEKTAEKLGYSVRQIQRIEKNLRAKFGVRI